MQKILISGFLSLLLTACGGGGSSSSLSTSTFVDSPVQGLYYVTSSGVTGVTDAAGTFEFNEGDTVTFKIGGSDGLDIGSSTPKADTPIFVTEMPAGPQIAQILQSFDTGGNLGSKIDLSKIVTIPVAAKNLLKTIIDERKPLASTASDLTAAIGSVWTENPTLATVVRPTPRTKAQVEAHLDASLAKLPARLPALAGGSFVGVEQSSKSFVIAAFADRWFYMVNHRRHLNEGIPTFGNNTLKLQWQKEIAFDDSWEQPRLCSGEYTVTSNKRGYFEFKGGQSGRDCETATNQTWKGYPIDTGYSITQAKGKSLLLEEQLEDGEISVPGSCLPMTLIVDESGASALMLPHGEGCGLGAQVSITAPFAKDGHAYITLMTTTPPAIPEAYVIAKLAGYEDRYVTLNFSNTGQAPPNEWSQQVYEVDALPGDSVGTPGRFLKVTDCATIAIDAEQQCFLGP